ncbi:hypothetical protein OJF2_34550 [Aquisphaera giovannonii]|uniref:Uncharacterized protein n=1 Tax=Aquisphaera giovannonii TaxID=406548 RepID=A0A5B9W4I8_9BACT|nr:hypothetical protein [Aquisphaera giovannonii]QEH34910.1 hypothetical protein OJF2_34550 [Aquisphaera giovannonii]
MGVPEVSSLDAADDSFVCPCCFGTSHAIWKLPNPLILHWVINPGLAFNELILGQRLPRLLFICKSCPMPLARRSYVFCPSCGLYSESMIWSGWNSFGHWLGIVCPDCGRRIPSLSNALSWVILKGLSRIDQLAGRPFEEVRSRWRWRFLAWEWSRAYRGRERISSRRANDEDA